MLMKLSDLPPELQETLRCLGDDSESGTVFLEHFNELTALGICGRGDDGHLRLTEIGKELYSKITNQDSD